MKDDLLSTRGDVASLRFAIKRALKRCGLPDEIVSVREELPRRPTLPNVVSKNPRMSAIFDLINRLARTTTTVLIEGETGTGKEQVARALHQVSRSRSGPLIAVSCAAVPETLLESELFGHEKGAFTSAVSQRKGRFELAEGGTLFLDEVGDIPTLMQAKLLRVLQERRFERVGGNHSVEVDVRVIAATNRCLQGMVRDGTFREDLYYRLNVVKIDLPPLRQRPEDIPLLAMHFAEKFASPNQPPKTLSPACMELLLRYGWPGNIRELENAIERACVSSRGELVEPEHLPSEVVRPASGKTQGHIDWSSPLPELLAELTGRIERRYLRKAVKRSQGNMDRCARLCGLGRRTLTNKLAKYQIAGRVQERRVTRTCAERRLTASAETQTKSEHTSYLRAQMFNLKQLEQSVLANGRVDSPEPAELRRLMYVGGKIDRRKADFLAELHKRVQHMTPSFEHFFYQAIKDHILADGGIDAEEAAWLRRLVFSDGALKDEERKFLHELKGEARHASPEFETLFAESMKQPQERHTCG